MVKNKFFEYSLRFWHKTWSITRISLTFLALFWNSRLEWIEFIVFYVCLTGLCCVEAHKFKTISVKNRSKRGLNRGYLAFIPAIMAYILHSIHCLLVQRMLIGSNGSWKIFRIFFYSFRQIIKFSTNVLLVLFISFPKFGQFFHHIWFDDALESPLLNILTLSTFDWKILVLIGRNWICFKPQNLRGKPQVYFKFKSTNDVAQPILFKTIFYSICVQ